MTRYLHIIRLVLTLLGTADVAALATAKATAHTNPTHITAL